MSEVELQVTYVVWAPDSTTDDAAQKRAALRTEHAAYFDGWHAKGAIRELFSPTQRVRIRRADVAMLYTVYGGAMTAEDIKLPVPADLGFTGSAIVLKADSLEDAWKIIKGDVYYQEAVVSGILPQPLVRTHAISRLIQPTVGQ